MRHNAMYGGVHHGLWERKSDDHGGTGGPAATVEEIKGLIIEQGEAWEQFKKNNDERLAAMENGLRDELKRRNRPGVSLGAPDSNNTNEQRPADPEGVKTLTWEDLQTKSGIAERLGIEQNSQISVGSYLRAVAGMKTTGEVKGLVEGTDASGGYTVPDALLPGILAALAPASSLLSAGAKLVSLEDRQAKSFNVAGVSTIPTAAWRAEVGSISESAPAFNSLTVIPRSLSFYFKVSRELLQDSPGLDEALTLVISKAFAMEMDRAGLLGSGTAPEPKGLANIAGVNAVSSGANGTALASYSPLVKAKTAIATVNAPTPTAAIMAPRTEGDFADLVDSTGQPLRRPDAIAKWQFGTSSQIPVDDTVGTSEDCSKVFVGDFRNFNVYLREDLSVQMLKEAFALTGEVGFVAHARVDFAALYPKAFAIVSGVRPAA